jgi:hypothetical protein
MVIGTVINIVISDVSLAPTDVSVVHATRRYLSVERVLEFIFKVAAQPL